MTMTVTASDAILDLLLDPLKFEALVEDFDDALFLGSFPGLTEVCSRPRETLVDDLGLFFSFGDGPDEEELSAVLDELCERFDRTEALTIIAGAIDVWEHELDAQEAAELAGHQPPQASPADYAEMRVLYEHGRARVADGEPLSVVRADVAAQIDAQRKNRRILCTPGGVQAM